MRRDTDLPGAQQPAEQRHQVLTRGGPVRIHLTPVDGGYRITVTDSGVGIASSEKESIFEPFRRSASTRETIPGVGLGLAVARKILAAHGGSMDVESEPGKGSTFSVRLPAGAARPPMP
ncbi:ATP-binding protein [Archangium gephyra]|nr:ATP-binding protein [Archangium gephyra]